jgi:hypothetical protein
MRTRFACIGLVGLLAVAADPDAHAAPFVVFDGLIFSNKPDLGLTPLTIADPHTLGDTKNGPPALARVQATMRTNPPPTNPVAIDIEDWPVEGDAATVKASVDNYLETLRRFRSVAPSYKLGFYSVVPVHDVWRAAAGSSTSGYRDWQRENDAVKPIADSVDAVFPSLYTFDMTVEQWTASAEANLSEARRIAPGKPVYCFLWPQFHEAARQAYQFVPTDFWRAELQTCWDHADGIVLWGGFTTQPDNRFHALPWDAKAPWWVATQSFLSSHHR